jgi:hypothetical protein
MRGDRSGLFIRYALADRLHKSLAEIDDMTVEEMSGWQAYIRVLAEKRKEA